MRPAASLCALLLPALALAEEGALRPVRISYHQRALFQDLGPGLPYAPRLEGALRVHGMELEGMVTDNASVGLYGNGMLKRRDNIELSDYPKVFSDWGGGMAAAFATWHVRAAHGLEAGVGAALGCGRLSRTEGLVDGSRFAAVQTDGFYVEPRLEAGWVTARERLVLRLQASWIQAVHRNVHRQGEASLPDPFARGATVGLSIGYNFPLLTTRR